jgi:hypothetical protein
LLPAEAWTLTLLVVLTVLTIVVGLGAVETVAVPVPVPVLLGAALIATGDVGFWVVVETVFGLEVGVALP